MRSLISIESRSKLDAFVKLVQPTVLLLQETWHRDHTPALIEDYNTYITPPSKQRNHGNMILVKKVFRHVHPIFTKLWTTKQVAVLIHVSDTMLLAVVSAYTDAMAIGSSDKDLQYLCKNVRQQYPTATLLVGGDLNRNSNDVDVLAKSINLTVATHAPDDHTRKQKGSPNAILDYFLTSQQSKQTTIPTLNPGLSDHIPINCTITLSAEDQQEIYQKWELQTVIKKGTMFKDLVQIVMDADFPKIPFLEVAKKLKHTKVRRVKKNDHFEHEEALKNVNGTLHVAGEKDKSNFVKTHNGHRG